MDVNERTGTNQMMAGAAAQATEASSVTNRVVGVVSDAAGRTAEKVRGIASAAQHAATDLDKSFPHTAQYMRSTAAGINEIVDMVQNTDVEKMKNAARDLVVKQPVLFVAGVALLGIAAWYLLSSTTEEQPQRFVQG